ncbi:hypothetical protein CW731_14395 [Polaribacter sp. ALD11]|uniref:hypothetical protein n=1 Tax=Polaribacter sp. ALD11 TaxID=2058137 RepID=UPI000C311D81|nr:hypothetical protein [Polaribacter sp. ALD11]AUC86396.1 hypothetical protein CW731_14395 [Polaribacter sp. ALD11]
MYFRAFIFLLTIIFITSCDKFSFSKTNKNQFTDTIVNFSSVDTSPSFKICDSLINKEEKSNCFRNTIHRKIGVELQKHEFIIKDSISEIIYVDLLIDAKGNIVLEAIQASESIKKQLPKLDSLLKVSVDRIPSIHPAIKRGIPVTTKYRLPILIQLKE